MRESRVLTTHNLVEAEKCHQTGVIRQGKLLAVGHPDELRSQAGGPRIEIVGRGFTEIAGLAAINQPLVSQPRSKVIPQRGWPTAGSLDDYLT